MPIASLDNQLCFALYSASNRITAIYRPILASHDLTYTQFIVLMSLWKKDGVSISYLAKKTGISNATMTPLLKLLEKKQFITRQMLPENERQKNIVLTNKGKDLSLASEAITEQAFCETGLTKTQSKELIKYCSSIISSS